MKTFSGKATVTDFLKKKKKKAKWLKEGTDYNENLHDLQGIKYMKYEETGKERMDAESDSSGV